MNHVDEVFSFTSKVRFNWASFPGGEEGICSKSVTNVGTSSTVFATTERTRINPNKPFLLSKSFVSVVRIHDFRFASIEGEFSLSGCS